MIEAGRRTAQRNLGTAALAIGRGQRGTQAQCLRQWRLALPERGLRQTVGSDKGTMAGLDEPQRRPRIDQRRPRTFPLRRDGPFDRARLCSSGRDLRLGGSAPFGSQTRGVTPDASTSAPVRSSVK